MPDAHKNLAKSTVATAPSPASSGTSLVVAAGEGTKFPTPPFNAAVWPFDAEQTTANTEFIRVTNIATDTLTITRTQEGSSARSIIVGDKIAAVITAKTLTDVESPAGGAAGKFLGYDAAGANLTSWQVPPLPGGWYSVEDYGAVGDDSTDDTTAIQNAINAAATAGGGVVFFRAKTYKITAALDLTLKNNVTLLGTGYFSIIKQYTTNADGIKTDAHTIASGDINLRFGIERLHLQSKVTFAGAGGNRAGVAISIASSREFYIDTVWIDGADQQGNRWKGGIWYDDAASTNVGTRHSVVGNFWIQSIADTTGDAGIKWRTNFTSLSWGHYWHDGTVQTEHDTAGNAYTVFGYAGLLDYQSDGTHISKVEFISEQWPIIIDPTQMVGGAVTFVTNQKFESVSAENPRSTNGPCMKVIGDATHGTQSVAFLGCNFYGSNPTASYCLDVDGVYQSITFTDCFFIVANGTLDVIQLRNGYSATFGPKFEQCVIAGAGSSAALGIKCNNDVKGVNASSCTFDNLAYGISLSGGIGHANTQCIFRGNQFLSTVTTPFGATSALYLLDPTNVIEGNTPPSANRYAARRDLQAAAQDESHAVFRIYADGGTGDDIVLYTFAARAAYTTENTAQDVWTYVTASDTAYLVKARVLAIERSGTKEGASYTLEAGFANIGGTLSQLGSTVKNAYEGHAFTDPAFAISGTSLKLQFTPDASNPTTVHAIIELQKAAT